MKKVLTLLVLLIFTVTISGCSLPGLTNAQGTTPGNNAAGSSKASSTDNANSVEGSVNQQQSSGISQEPSTNEGKTVKVTLYFSTEDNSAIKKEERDIQVIDGAILKACVMAFMEGSKTAGLHNNVPKDTVFIGINLKNGVAIVDFSKQFGTANGMAEITERIALVNTLTGINGVYRVKILLDGSDYIGASGKPLGEMGPTRLDPEGLPMASVEKTVTLYFGNSNADKVVAEKRKVQVYEDESLEEVILYELMAGPRSTELYSTVPKGTKLLSIKTSNSLCTLNLSHEFVDNSPGGTASEAITLNSVVNSLTQLSYIKKVQFLVDGQRRDVYTHAVFDKPFSRNEAFIGQ